MLLNDALLLQNPHSWTVQTVAHEAKHFAKDDNIKAFFLLSGLALVALGVTHRAGHAIIARWSGSLGFADFAHPASLPLAVLLLNAFYVVALPPVNAFRQHVELEADRFALELTRDSTTQAQMTASWTSQKGAVPEWSLFFQLFRASHPSIAERIRLANAYRPWLEGKPLVYANDFAAPVRSK
jgi:STE24 endopeptidase